MVSKVLSNDSGRFLDLQEFFVLKLWFLSQTVKIKIFWPPNVITDFHEKNKINKSYINKIMLPQNRTLKSSFFFLQKKVRIRSYNSKSITKLFFYYFTLLWDLSSVTCLLKDRFLSEDINTSNYFSKQLLKDRVKKFGNFNSHAYGWSPRRP